MSHKDAIVSRIYWASPCLGPYLLHPCVSHRMEAGSTAALPTLPGQGAVAAQLGLCPGGGGGGGGGEEGG